VQWHPAQGTRERLFVVLVRAVELRTCEQAFEALPGIARDLPEFLADV